MSWGENGGFDRTHKVLNFCLSKSENPVEHCPIAYNFHSLVNTFFVGASGRKFFAGWVVLAISWSAGWVDVGAELCRFMALHTFRKSPDLVRIRFPLHKEFRAAEISFYLHREFRAAGIRFYLHKPLGGDVEEIGHFQRT